MSFDYEHATADPTGGQEASSPALELVDGLRGTSGAAGVSPPSPDPGVGDHGAARELAERYRLPLVDLAVTGVSPEATKLIPLRVLERVVAVPYAVDGDVLKVAVTDPAHVHGIDELRMAARQAVEFAVAPADDVLLEIRRLSRASEALGAM